MIDYVGILEDSKIEAPTGTVRVTTGYICVGGREYPWNMMRCPGHATTITIECKLPAFVRIEAEEAILTFTEAK